jgi:lipopolysaccharide heptosyltransferase II
MNDWQQARNILCIRLDSLGDVLMCTPAIRAIQESGRGRMVTLLSSASGAAAAAFIPEIDAVIEYSAPWMKSSNPHAAGADLKMIHALQSRSFDAAVIFTSYSQSALPAAYLCYLAGIPLRLAHCRENPYQMLTDWVPDPEPQKCLRHEVQRQLDLVAMVGAGTTNQKLSFQVPEPDLSWARQRLAALGIVPQKPWIMLHPGATAASRRYPVHHWTQVTRKLENTLGYPIVFTGNADEAELISNIQQTATSTTAHTLAGELDLGKLGAIISLASVVISNNTGPAHLAAAIGTPLVDLYALTNPQHTPWQVKSRVLFHDVECRYCYKSVCPELHHDCLNKIQPEQVVEAVQALLQPDTQASGAGLPEIFGPAET